LDTPLLLGELVNTTTEPENKGSWLPTCPKQKLGRVKRGGAVKTFNGIHGVIFQK
jgi:hypothetical protein